MILTWSPGAFPAVGFYTGYSVAAAATVPVAAQARTPSTMIPSNLAGYREEIRLLLGIQTPREKWTLDNDLGMAGPVVPNFGAQPSAQPRPTNYSIDAAVRSAVDRCNMVAGTSDNRGFADLTVAAVQSTYKGPLLLDLSSLDGYPARHVLSADSAQWYDGQSYWPLQPVFLPQLDAQRNQYMNDGPGVPLEYSVDGYTLYLKPAPALAGTIRFRISSQMLAPSSDSEGFAPLPESYDKAVLYVALMELATINSQDAEMVARAMRYEKRAEEGLTAIAAWFDHGSMSEHQGGITYDADNVRRYRRM